MADKETSSSLLDISQLRTPIQISGKPVEQVLSSIHYGSPELRCLLLDECDLIFECKVCRALFRDLPNFISHKRVYCTKSSMENRHVTIASLPEEKVVVIQPQAPEEIERKVLSATQRGKQQTKSTRPNLEDTIMRIQSGELGRSHAYQVYTEAAEKLQRQKEGMKVATIRTTAIPTNKNAVFIDVNMASVNIHERQQQAGVASYDQNRNDTSVTVIKRKTGDRHKNTRNMRKSVKQEKHSSEPQKLLMEQLKEIQQKRVRSAPQNRESSKNVASPVVPNGSSQKNVASPVVPNGSSQKNVASPVVPNGSSQKAVASTNTLRVPKKVSDNAGLKVVDSANVHTMLDNEKGTMVNFKITEEATNSLVKRRASSKVQPKVDNKNELLTNNAVLASSKVQPKVDNKNELLTNNAVLASSKVQPKADNKIQLHTYNAVVAVKTRKRFAEQSLICSKCSAAFATRKGLGYHMKIHHSTKRTFYPCPYCQSVFYYFYGITRHLFKNHDKTLEEVNVMRKQLREKSFTKQLCTSSLKNETRSIVLGSSRSTRAFGKNIQANAVQSTGGDREDMSVLSDRPVLKKDSGDHELTSSESSSKVARQKNTQLDFVQDERRHDLQSPRATVSERTEDDGESQSVRLTNKHQQRATVSSSKSNTFKKAPYTKRVTNTSSQTRSSVSRHQENTSHSCPKCHRSFRRKISCKNHMKVCNSLGHRSLKKLRSQSTVQKGRRGMTESTAPRDKKVARMAESTAPRDKKVARLKGGDQTTSNNSDVKAESTSSDQISSNVKGTARKDAFAVSETQGRLNDILRQTNSKNTQVSYGEDRASILTRRSSSMDRVIKHDEPRNRSHDRSSAGRDQRDSSVESTQSNVEGKSPRSRRNVLSRYATLTQLTKSPAKFDILLKTDSSNAGDRKMIDSEILPQENSNGRMSDLGDNILNCDGENTLNDENDESDLKFENKSAIIPEKQTLSPPAAKVKVSSSSIVVKNSIKDTQLDVQASGEMSAAFAINREMSRTTTLLQKSLESPPALNPSPQKCQPSPMESTIQANSSPSNSPTSTDNQIIPQKQLAAAERSILFQIMSSGSSLKSETSSPNVELSKRESSFSSSKSLEKEAAKSEIICAEKETSEGNFKNDPWKLQKGVADLARLEYQSVWENSEIFKDSMMEMESHIRKLNENPIKLSELNENPMKLSEVKKQNENPMKLLKVKKQNKDSIKLSEVKKLTDNPIKLLELKKLNENPIKLSEVNKQNENPNKLLELKCDSKTDNLQVELSKQNIEGLEIKESEMSSEHKLKNSSGNTIQNKISKQQSLPEPMVVSALSERPKRKRKVPSRNIDAEEMLSKILGHSNQPVPRKKRKKSLELEVEVAPRKKPKKDNIMEKMLPVADIDREDGEVNVNKTADVVEAALSHEVVIFDDDDISEIDDGEIDNEELGKVKGRFVSNRMYVLEKFGSKRKRLKCYDQVKVFKMIDEEKLKCLACGESCTQVSNLRRHVIRQHLKWSRFKCKLCKFDSYDRSECTTHLIRGHRNRAINLRNVNRYIIDLVKQGSHARSIKKSQTIKVKQSRSQEENIYARPTVKKMLRLPQRTKEDSLTSHDRDHMYVSRGEKKLDVQQPQTHMYVSRGEKKLDVQQPQTHMYVSRGEKKLDVQQPQTQSKEQVSTPAQNSLEVKPGLLIPDPKPVAVVVTLSRKQINTLTSSKVKTFSKQPNQQLTLKPGLAHPVDGKDVSLKATRKILPFNISTRNSPRTFDTRPYNPGKEGLPATAVITSASHEEYPFPQTGKETIVKIVAPKENLLKESPTPGASCLKQMETLSRDMTKTDCEVESMASSEILSEDIALASRNIFDKMRIQTTSSLPVDVASPSDGDSAMVTKSVASITTEVKVVASGIHGDISSPQVFEVKIKKPHQLNVENSKQFSQSPDITIKPAPVNVENSKQFSQSPDITIKPAPVNVENSKQFSQSPDITIKPAPVNVENSKQFSQSPDITIKPAPVNVENSKQFSQSPDITIKPAPVNVENSKTKVISYILRGPQQKLTHLPDEVVGSEQLTKSLLKMKTLGDEVSSSPASVAFPEQSLKAALPATRATSSQVIIDPANLQRKPGQIPAPTASTGKATPIEHVKLGHVPAPTARTGKAAPIERVKLASGQIPAPTARTGKATPIEHVNLASGQIPAPTARTGKATPIEHVNLASGQIPAPTARTGKATPIEHVNLASGQIPAATARTGKTAPVEHVKLESGQIPAPTAKKGKTASIEHVKLVSQRTATASKEMPGSSSALAAALTKSGHISSTSASSFILSHAQAGKYIIYTCPGGAKELTTVGSLLKPLTVTSPLPSSSTPPVPVVTSSEAKQGSETQEATDEKTFLPGAFVIRKHYL